jgi:hypothetical protein
LSDVYDIPASFLVKSDRQFIGSIGFMGSIGFIRAIFSFDSLSVSFSTFSNLGSLRINSNLVTVDPDKQNAIFALNTENEVLAGPK